MTVESSQFYYKTIIIMTALQLDQTEAFELRIVNFS